MNKEKRIEEMAKITARACPRSCSECNTMGIDGAACIEVRAAEELYAAGYRKQSEGKWIITNNRNLEIIRECSNCHAKTYYPMELKFNCRKSRYCEDCGAKMGENDDEQRATD